MQRLSIMVLTARMTFTFFSFARGMSDGFVKAAMSMTGLNVILFLQMFILMTAIAYNDKNPLMVWGLIIVSTKVDSILEFGIDTGSRSNPIGALHSLTAVKAYMKGMSKNKSSSSSLTGSLSK